MVPPLKNFCIGMRGMTPVPVSRKPHWMVLTAKFEAPARVIWLGLEVAVEDEHGVEALHHDDLVVGDLAFGPRHAGGAQTRVRLTRL